MSNTPHWETSPLRFKDVESFVSAKAEILKHYNPTGFNFTYPLITEKIGTGGGIILKGNTQIKDRDLINILSEYIEHDFNVLYVTTGDSLTADVLYSRFENNRL